MSFHRLPLSFGRWRKRGKWDRVVLCSGIGHMHRLGSFRPFRCWFSGFDPRGCFSTRRSPTLVVRACYFSISPLRRRGGNDIFLVGVLCGWTWVVGCFVRIHLVGIPFAFGKARQTGFKSGDFGTTSCGSEVGMGGSIEYIFLFHGILLELCELCGTQLLSNSFLCLSFCPLQLGLGIGWLAGFSLDITRMLGSIPSPC